MVNYQQQLNQCQSTPAKGKTLHTQKQEGYDFGDDSQKVGVKSLEWSALCQKASSGGIAPPICLSVRPLVLGEEGVAEYDLNTYDVHQIS